MTRRGHTEAAVDLAWLAGCEPVGLLCEIIDRHALSAISRLEHLMRAGSVYWLLRL